MIDFAVRRPVAVFMVCIGLVVLGLIAAQRIPVQLLPNIQTPEFTVVTNFKGATPEEVETLITAPIERALSTVGGLEKTVSNSERERSEVKLNFKNSINYLETISLIREKVDSVGLPEGTTRPKILRFQANAAPVIRLAAKPGKSNMTTNQLADLLRDVLVRRLEGVDGVAMVSLEGAPERKIQVTLDPVAVQAYGIAMSSIPGLIQSRNRSYSAGSVQFEGKSTSVKLSQSIQSIEELRKTIVKKDGEKWIRLGDIAQISEMVEKPAVRTHLQGKDSLVVEIKKEAEANTVVVATEVKKVVDGFLAEYADDVQGWVLLDQGEQIEVAIDNVGESVFHGGILAGLVIFLLLQSWWPTFVVSLSMPISILITFILMYFTGISFNLMSLAGLALGVGMLVDNSTIVLDNIHILQMRMADAKQAAYWGTKTVFGAITGSTLSTMAVFAPLAFVEGTIGQMFRDVAATVCYSLAASLFSAVFIIPMLSGLQVKAKVGAKGSDSEDFLTVLSGKLSAVELFASSSWQAMILDISKKYLATLKLSAMILLSIGNKLFSLLGHYLQMVGKLVNKKFLDPFLNIISTWILALEDYLRDLLPKTIKNSKNTVRWTVGVTVLGMAILMWKGAELFPDESVDRLVYELEFPNGQSLEVTENRTLEIEKKLVGVPDVESVSTVIGESGSHTAQLTLMVPEDKSQGINKQVSGLLSHVVNLNFTRIKEAMVGEGKPLQVEVYSENLQELKENTLKLKAALSEMPELADIETNVKSDLSEIVIQFSNDKLSWYGVDVNAFSSVLKPMLMGLPGGNLQIKGDELPVHLRMPANYFNSIDKVKYLSLNDEDPNKRLYISQVSDIAEKKILSSIRRFNRKRMSLISANLNRVDLETAGKKIKEKIGASGELSKMTWKLSGQDEERKKSQSSLLIAVGLSVFLIYLMLAGQFENLVQPVIVLCAVPLCISGVAFLLLLSGINVSALVFVGFIILVGVSVNTSIVMVDFANQMVAEGKSLSEAISEATVRRMRPILVTTLSGILGLVPMALAIGKGSAMQQPLAVTMIGGHISATILTVLVVPIVYVKLAKKVRHGEG